MKLAKISASTLPEFPVKSSQKRTSLSAAINPPGHPAGSQIFDYRPYKPRLKLGYIPTADQVSRLRCLQGPVLGLDVEYRVLHEDKKMNTKVTGQKPALLQISNELSIFLIHLRGSMSKVLPQDLVAILINPNIMKVGVGIRHDCMTLIRAYPDQLGGKEEHPKSSKPASIVELCDLALLVDPRSWPAGVSGISLAALCEKYLGKKLRKNANSHKGNWAGDLSEKQMNYAANDAEASLQVYLNLRSIAREKKIDLDLAKLCRPFKSSNRGYGANPESKKD